MVAAVHVDAVTRRKNARERAREALANERADDLSFLQWKNEKREERRKKMATSFCHDEEKERSHSIV